MTLKKVLVYAETVREARNFYPLKEGETVGYRTYSEFNNGEEFDDVFIVDESKVKKAKK